MKDEIVEGWSRDSDGYSRYVRNSMAARGEKKAWQDVLTEALGKDKLKILDVGTGPGIMAFQLAELGHDVTGIDLADGMLREARANAGRYGLKVEFQKGDAENLPFPDASFDAVVSRWVLWTLPNPEKALREWQRVVRPGGKVVYIDGNWHLDLEESRIRRLWYVTGRTLTAITERRNPFGRMTGKKDENPSDELWSKKARRPAADLEMLRKIGYEKVEVRSGLKRRTLKGLNYIKYGFWKDYFLISFNKGQGRAS